MSQPDPLYDPYEEIARENAQSAEELSKREDDEDHDEPKIIPINKAPEDKESVALALTMAIADAREYLDIEQIAFRIVAGMYHWQGPSVSANIEELSRQLMDNIGKPYARCGKAHNNGRETCTECEVIRLGI